MGLLEKLFGPNIKKLKKRGDIDGLVAVLSHKDAYYRERAIWALEALGSRCPLQPVLAALQDESKKVRLTAALAVLALDPPTGKKHLEQMIEGSDQPVEIKVALAIALDYSHAGSYAGRECLAMARAAPREGLDNLVDKAMFWLHIAGHGAAYSAFIETLERSANPELRQTASSILKRALSANSVRDAHIDRIKQALEAHERRRP